jgi:hypothetical protein
MASKESFFNGWITVIAIVSVVKAEVTKHIGQMFLGRVFAGKSGDASRCSVA